MSRKVKDLRLQSVARQIIPFVKQHLRLEPPEEEQFSERGKRSESWTWPVLSAQEHVSAFDGNGLGLVHGHRDSVRLSQPKAIAGVIYVAMRNNDQIEVSRFAAGSDQRPL